MGKTYYVMDLDTGLGALGFDLLAPLRAAGVASKNRCDKATPERVVEMAVQRIADLQRQVARLRKGMQQRDAVQHGKGVRRKLGEAVELLAQIRDSIERAPAPAAEDVS
jgi:hypothetical protein